MKSWHCDGSEIFVQLRGYTERNSKNHLRAPIMIKWCLIESFQRLKNKKKLTILS